MMVNMDKGIKIPATFPLTINDKMLVVMGDMDICPRLDTLPPITHVTMVYC